MQVLKETETQTQGPASSVLGMQGPTGPASSVLGMQGPSGGFGNSAFGSGPRSGGGWSAFASEPKNQGSTIAQTIKATEDSAAAKAAIQEKRKYEEAVNLTSEKSYPSLGSSAPAAKTTLNFMSVVKAALAKEEESNESDYVRPQQTKTVQSFMDTFDDEEDEEMDEVEESEFNADTVQTRRRGDKGVW
jgi:hypothetical protein